mgnify:CR=1 FL=1
MAKKEFWLIVDTETTIDDKVADFGAVVVDKKGEIFAQCAILVHKYYDDRDNHCLFFIKEDKNTLWAKESLDRRYKNYNDMLEAGSRSIATVAAINRWLAGVKGKYNPYLTAYNLAFDISKCLNTNIDLSIFGNRKFCLWGASQAKWGNTKKYKNFVLEVHGFNAPTKHGNMTYKTNAEIMARYVLNNPTLEDEPHTALEDVIFYELPILTRLLATEKKKNWLNPPAYNWRKYQAKDHFIAK